MNRKASVLIAGLLFALLPVAPAHAATSAIIVVNTTAIASSATTLSTGDTISISVCFQGAVTRSGGSNADVKLLVNTRAATGISWGGTRSSLGVGLTDNCLVFPDTVLSSDTSQSALTATALTLDNSATLTVVGFDTITAPSTAIFAGILCSAGNCGGGSVTLSVDVTAPTASTFLPAVAASFVVTSSNLVLTTSKATTPYVSVSSRSCTGGNTATVVAQRNHDIAVGDLVYPLLIGPGYDSGTGGKTYFRVTAVSGRSISYAIGCTNESSAFASGGIAPLRYVTVGEDADTAKTISGNIVIASNIATLTSTGHGFVVGDVVVIAGLAQKEANGAFAITAVADANTLAVNLTKAAVASAANVANVADVSSTAVAVGSTAIRVIEAIPTVDSTRVSFSNSSPFTMTVNPTATLPGSTAVHARVGVGAIRDNKSNSYAGIADATTWNFGTTTGPSTINSITSTVAGSYKSGAAAILIQVRFNQSVTVSGTPELLLNAGGGAVATYASGSGTKFLTFTYTIGAGHSTLAQPGQKLNVTGISLPSGATITGVSADTTVPASGASGSLNSNTSIVIDNAAPQLLGGLPFPTSTGVARDTSFTLKFSEDIVLVADKSFTIKRFDDGQTARTITTATGVSESSAGVVVINPARDLDGPTIAVTNKALTGNVATLTTAAAHGLLAGATIVVSDVDSTFNGRFTVVAVPTATTLTYAKTGTDVTSAAVSPAGGIGTYLEVTNKALTSDVATLTTAANHGLIVGDLVVVGGVDATFNGTFAVVSVPTTTTFTYAKTATNVTSVAVSPTGRVAQQIPTQYYISIPADAITDVAGNPYTGLLNTNYSFTTGVDTIKPFLLASDPLAGMTTFAPLNNAGSGPRPMTLTFSEGVSAVADKNITITPAGGSAVTFATTSDSVVVSSSTVTLTPSVTLASNTTFTLSIEAGAFVDSSTNANLVITFTFATNVPAGPAPGSGGGGGLGPIGPAPGSCGPPPAPPCLIGPPPSFGAGGVPLGNSLTGGNMGSVDPNAFRNFNPNQAGAISPDAMAGFNRNQFAALPPSAMGGFNQNQMAALPPEAMGGFNSNQMRQLPPSAMGGFNSSQMAALPPEAMGGFNSNQMRQLPPSAMGGFNSSQLAALPPSAMGGFDSKQFASLPPSAMGGFNPDQMRQMPPSAMGGFNQNQMAALPPAAMQGFNSNQMKVLSPGAMGGFNQNQMAALPPSAMIGFKPAQFGALQPDAISGMQQNQFKAIPPNAMAAFTPNQMDAMPLGALSVISPSQFKSLTPAVIASMSPEQRSALPQQAFNQAANVAPTNVGNAASLAGALTGWNVDKVPANAFANFKPTDAAKLSPEVFSSLNPNQFKAMPATAFSGFKPAQVGALPPEVFAGMKPTQFSAMPATAFGSFNPEQLGAMPASAFSALKPSQMGSMPPAAMTTMSPQQVGALPATAMAGLKADQVAALPATALATMKPAQVGALTPAAVGSLSADQVTALPAAAFGAMKPTQVGAMPAAVMATMSPQQVGALPATAMAGLKADQVAALPATALATMKPAQVGALTPAAVGSLSADQVTALPAAAFGAMKPTQVGAMPAAVMATMSPQQVGALPATAVAGLKADQVAALPATALATMKPAAVAALSPASAAGFSNEKLAAMTPAQEKALKPSFVNKLTPEQKAALKG